MTELEALEHFKEQIEVFGGEHKQAIDIAIQALEK